MLIRWREAVSTRIIRTSAMSVRAHTGMGLRIRLRPSAASDAKHGGYAPPGAGQAERPKLPHSGRVSYRIATRSSMALGSRSGRCSAAQRTRSRDWSCRNFSNVGQIDPRFKPIASRKTSR